MRKTKERKNMESEIIKRREFFNGFVAVPLYEFQCENGCEFVGHEKINEKKS